VSLRARFMQAKGLFKGLHEQDADRNPLALFGQWFEDARRAGISLPESMCVATATPDGVPTARMMLLKGYDERGFRFFTNYESRKGHILDQNPAVALVFHWVVLQRQVRIEGNAEKVSAEESGAYFQSRPYGSQLGAWASRQSEPLADRAELERRFKELKAKYKEGVVPLPPFWGGYRVKPDRIEFWQGRADRLHDRLAYTRDGEKWSMVRLAP